MLKDGNQINLEQGQTTNHFLCQYEDISQSGYYKWRNRIRSLNRHEQKHNNLIELIISIQSQQSDGYRYLVAVMLTKIDWK